MYSSVAQLGSEEVGIRGPAGTAHDRCACLWHAVSELQPHDEEDGGYKSSSSRPRGGQVEQVSAAAYQAPDPRQRPK